MDELDKIRCVKVIRQKMVEVLESGALKDPRSQYEFINDCLHKVMPFDYKKINVVIWKYFDDQDVLKKRIEEKQKELQKLMDEYGDNVKEIYEMIKKL